MARRKKALVAMSGGVDSSVAAGLLKEQGHDVVGVFMCLSKAAVPPPHIDSAATAPVAQHRGCCSIVDAGDARLVAGKFGIPFYVLNLQADFSRLIDYFCDEYAAGRTPNPCILCNQWLKFGRLLAYADAVEADLIATGHYARVALDADRPILRRARYMAKDQSYVLFSISLPILRRTVFPLGDMTKEEVRGHARRFGLALHDKPESQDICFVPDGDYARLVQCNRPEAFRAGAIRHIDGRILGQHPGLPHFTLGQRRGLGIALGDPVYVTDLDPRTNIVTIGPREALYSDRASAEQVNWLCEVPDAPFAAQVKIRYSHAAAPALVTPLQQARVHVRFDQPQPAITPGQALVFYHDDQVLGGGWITR
jgi:tRNA-specific 2-thiouridylase